MRGSANSSHTRAPKLLYPRVPACSFGRGGKVCVPNSRGYHCWQRKHQQLETRNHRKSSVFYVRLCVGATRRYVCFDVCQRCSWIVLDTIGQRKSYEKQRGAWYFQVSSPKDETPHTSTLMQRKNGKTYVTKFCFFLSLFSELCHRLYLTRGSADSYASEEAAWEHDGLHVSVRHDGGWCASTVAWHSLR